MYYFSYFLMTLLMFFGLFLIGLILLQRGRGGGLAGAFGGMGGQSAFGTKAGDVFTRITIGVAAGWILLCAGSVVALHNSTNSHTDSGLFKQDQAGDATKKADPKANDPFADNVDLPKADASAPAANQPDDKKPEAPVVPEVKPAEKSESKVDGDAQKEAPKAEETKKSDDVKSEEPKKEEPKKDEAAANAQPEKAAEQKPAEPPAAEKKPE